MKDTIKFYLHHLEQLDRLLEVIELLKIENKQLRQMVLKNTPNKPLPQKNPTVHSKPRISCWTFKDEAI
ncbi:MAG: hypothetical protein JSR17_11535 [Proteobacteria bacterium]|nr:hypothetical protein [Pseudomonadota bacterium]